MDSPYVQGQERFRLRASVTADKGVMPFVLWMSPVVYGQRLLQRIAMGIPWFCLWSVLVSGMCYAQSVSSRELIEKARFYHDKIVVYEGEVVGDIMIRGDSVWLAVNDGENAVGIWADAALVKDIIYKGDYKTRGDWIAVTGVFHASCLEHGGDLDIHAQTIKKLRPGSKIVEFIDPQKKKWAVFLLVAVFVLWFLRPRTGEKQTPQKRKSRERHTDGYRLD